MFTVIINQEGIESLSKAKVSFKKFSILNYVKYTFGKLPKNLRTEVLKQMLAFYGVKLDYNQESLFFKCQDQEKVQGLIKDLISENVTTAEVEILEANK